MKRSLLGAGLVAMASAVAAPAAAQTAANAPWLPGLPTPPRQDPAPQPAVASASADLSPAQLYEHVRRGVVTLERSGVPTAIGTILEGDGRVLTALSGLAGGQGVDVRYADGTLVYAKVERSDKAADLALLVPQSTTWTEGLSASEMEPLGTEFRAMLPARGFRLVPALAGVRGPADAHGRDGEMLRMLDVDVKGLPVVGAPLLDVTGRVVAVLVRACKGPARDALSGGDDPPAASAKSPAQAARACLPVLVGAPVPVIRAFLTRTPAGPWLGIRGESESSGSVHGVRIVAVAPSSPAERSALRSSDVIVAVDGRPIDTPESLADVIGRHVAGDAVRLLVFGGEKFRDVVVSLRPTPEAPQRP